MKISKKLLNILFACIFAFTCSQYTAELNGAIPEYKGLYTLFTKDGDSKPATDTIGIGQSLKYSNWLENVYTYAPEENAARRLIAILWNKRLFEGPRDAQVFTETNNFVPSDSDKIRAITGEDIGKLIKYIREFKKNGNPTLRPKLSEKCTGLNNLFASLEGLKYSDNFIPEMAESILWAFFESKTNWGEKEFKACLNEIDENYWKKLNNHDAQASSYTIDEMADITIIENIANKLISSSNNRENLIRHDALTSYLIKSEKNKAIPTKVSQTSLRCKHPVTGVEPKLTFPTCFESSILDILSILTYDSENLKYDPSILPEAIRTGATFQNLIDQVFKVFPKDTVFPEYAMLAENGQTEGGALLEESVHTKEKEFILAENINKSVQTWVNLISNLPETLKYGNNNDTGNYDLNPSFENFVKVLNKFLDLGFAITDTKDTLELNYNNGGTASTITVQKDKLTSWQALFDAISEKLSTEQRCVKLTVEQNEIDGAKFKKINEGQDSSICVGPIKISICNTNLHIIIKKFESGIGHAYIICPERDKSKIAIYQLQELKNKLIKSASTNKNIIPLFMFLPYVQTIENNQQIEELLYYSFDVKDHNTKLAFLKTIFESDAKIIKIIYSNQSTYKLVSKLINLLPENDENFISPLIKYLDSESNELYWQDEIESKIVKFIKTTIKDPENPSDYLLRILPFLSVNNKNTFLKDKLIKILQNTNTTFAVLNAILIHNKVSILKKLLQNKDIDINNAENEFKYTLLHAACKNNNVEIVKILLNEPRVNVNAGCHDENTTSLHIACLLGNMEIIESLLNHKDIDIFTKDKYRDTAKDMARKYNNNRKIFEILEKKEETVKKLEIEKELMKILGTEEAKTEIEKIKNGWLFINA